MDAERCRRWMLRHHGLSARAAGPKLVGEVVGLLAAASSRQALATDHFQACLNTRDRFDVVKLVHVAENAQPGRERDGWEHVAGRRRAVLEALALLNRRGKARFPADRLEKVYEAVLSAGAGGWFPIWGFEFLARQNAFPEVSLYCEHRAGAAATAAARALGVRDLERVAREAPRLFAMGVDLLADGGARLKLYSRAPASAAARLLEQLEPVLRPAEVLVLSRTRPDGEFEDAPKAYAALRSAAPGRATACTGEELLLLARGPLQRFAREILPATRGQNLFYIGASEEKTEVYFGEGGGGRR